MSDELECFRRAAELGCPDIVICGQAERAELLGRPMLIASSKPGEDILGCCLPSDSPRINRYAAAVCAEWWRVRWNDNPLEDFASMIYFCRAFGRKYGN